MPTFDENLRRFLIAANVFNPTAAPQQPTMPQPAPTGNRIDEIYNPRNDMQDQYQRHIETFPTKEKPTTGRKIIASLAGMSGGPEAAWDVLDRPHNQNVADWKGKSEALGSAATQESRFNRDQTSFAIQQARAEIAQQQADTAALKNQQIYETKMLELQQRIVDAQAKLELATARLELDKDSRNNQMLYKDAQLEFQKTKAEGDATRAAMIIENLERERDRDNEVRMRQLELAEQKQQFTEQPVNRDEELIRDSEGNPVARRTQTYRGATPSGSRFAQQGSKGDIALPNESGKIDERIANSIEMIGKDGETYRVPKDKITEAERAGMRKK